MSETMALKTLEAMPEPEFQAFFKSLPSRVQLLVRGGMQDWREVLPQWYVKSVSKETDAPINPDDIPF